MAFYSLYALLPHVATSPKYTQPIPKKHLLETSDLSANYRKHEARTEKRLRYVT